MAKNSGVMLIAGGVGVAAFLWWLSGRSPGAKPANTNLTGAPPQPTQGGPTGGDLSSASQGAVLGGVGGVEKITFTDVDAGILTGQANVYGNSNDDGSSPAGNTWGAQPAQSNVVYDSSGAPAYIDPASKANGYIR